MTSLTCRTPHLLHGGLGNDAIQLEGNASDYIIKQEFAKITITSINNPGDVVTLINAESLQFADEVVTINYESQSEISLITGTFAQMFGRQPHIEGAQYWAEALANEEVSLGQVALFFMNSEEQKQKIGFDITKADTPIQVEQFFDSFLGRPSNPEGKAFWSNHLTTGALTLEDFATQIISSPEMKSHEVSTAEWDFAI